MKALPIRWKFALWTAAAAGLTLAIFAAGTLANLYRNRVIGADHLLAEETGEIRQALLAAQPGPVETGFGWVRLGTDGRVLRGDPRLSPALARRIATHPQPATYPDGRATWRALASPLAGGTLVVGYDLAEVDELITDLLLAYALSLPLVALGTALGGWWVAGRALQPVRALAAAAEAIQSDRLEQRLPLPPADDELRRLSATLNAMLGRLQGSFEQAQRFAADASHELRTPLTIMRGEIEQMLRRSGHSTDYEAKLLSLQEEIARLDRITEQLLLLARFDAGQVRIERCPVDFSSLLAEACEDAELLASPHQVTLESRIAPGLCVAGDAHQLRRLVLNLLDNGARHNRPDGRIRCTLERHDDTAVLRIANTGPGIPAALRPQVFQRFFRADPSRTGRQGHGLGLSLCREIARSHGGTLELLDSADPALTEFSLTLGLVPPAG